MDFRMKLAAAAVMCALAVSASASTLPAVRSPLGAQVQQTEPDAADGIVKPRTPPSLPSSAATQTAPLSDAERLFTQPNPAARSGYLPNGLRYGVMRRGGTRQVSILFHVGAGSANEGPNELGVAHFLEHMAFNGSRSFPADSLARQFAEIGVAFGRDQNATTDVTGTTYRLDISEVTDAKLDLAFKWLREIADGLNIDQAEVERERGVVLSEYIGSRGPTTEAAEAMGRFMGPTLLAPQRSPIGTRESITGMSAATIRGFYERWYRPEVSAVIVVGDGDAASFKARIEQALGDWRNERPAPAAPLLGRLEARRSAAALTLNSPQAPNVMQVCRGRDKDPLQREGVVTRTRDFETQVWTQVLEERLNHLTNTGNPPFVQASVSRDDFLESASFACISLMLRNNDWRSAARVVAEESRRLELHGLTPREYEAQTEVISAGLDALVASADTYTAAVLADAFLGNFERNGTFSTAQEDRRIGSQALERMTRESVLAEFKRVWSDAGQPLVVLIAPTAVAQSEVLGQWNQAMAAPAPAPPTDVEVAPWGYASFGPPGKVASRQVMQDPDFVRLEFENGVRVNFKQTINAADRIEIRIRFGDGMMELSPADGTIARVGASMLLMGGLGKNSYEDIQRICQGHACGFQLQVERDSFLIASATRPVDLDLALQILSAFLSDPGFRPEVDARIPTIADSTFRTASADPSFVAGIERERAMRRPHAAGFPTQAAMRAMTMADFRRVLLPVLTRDALEVTVIGDVNEAKATEALARTLGALPARERVSRMLPDAPRIRLPSPAPAPIRITHAGPADKALVQATWRLFGYSATEMRRRKVIDLLTSMLTDTYIDSLRERLGNSYSPMANAQIARGGDDGALAVEIATSPQATGAVLAELRAIARRFAAGDIPPEALERARRPLLAYGATRELGNEWWVELLDGSWEHPDQLLAAQTWSDYESITLDEIKAEAKAWLGPEPLVIIATPRVAAATAQPRRGSGARQTPAAAPDPAM